jgi:diadenosine tetraphosphate (Ap4A) HIT family hydrolase
MAAIDQGQATISERLRPDGFNVGFNENSAAGQTVFHFHLHIIPRYEGDVADPREHAAAPNLGFHALHPHGRRLGGRAVERKRDRAGPDELRSQSVVNERSFFVTGLARYSLQ